ncbi:MAG: DUF5719 family protein [Marmoricola sp.]
MSARRRATLGRRIDSGTTRRALGMVALALATIVCLLVASTVSMRVRPNSANEMTSSAQARQIVCPGHGPDSDVVGSAVLSQGPIEVKVAGADKTIKAQRSKRLAKGSAQSSIVRTESGALVASHVERLGAALAGCVEAASAWWFVGAGASNQHASELVLVNPRPGVAIADVRLIGETNEPIAAAGLTGISVASGAEVVIDLPRLAPTKGQVAVEVTTTRGLVAAAMVDRQADGSAPASGVLPQWLPATAAPAKTSWMVGLPAAKNRSKRRPDLLVIANPGATTAVVAVLASGPTGSFAPAGIDPIRVKARQVAVVDLGKSLKADTGSVQVASPTPVSATLWRAGVAVVSTTAYDGASALAINQNADSTLVSTATAGAASVRVRAFDKAGQQVLNDLVKVEAGASVLTALPPDAASVMVEPSAAGVISAVIAKQAASIGSSVLAHASQEQAAITVRPR